jgi:hypothetical protein
MACVLRRIDRHDGLRRLFRAGRGRRWGITIGVAEELSLLPPFLPPLWLRPPAMISVGGQDKSVGGHPVFSVVPLLPPPASRLAGCVTLLLFVLLLLLSALAAPAVATATRAATTAAAAACQRLLIS